MKIKVNFQIFKSFFKTFKKDLNLNQVNSSIYSSNFKLEHLIEELEVEDNF